LIFPEWFIGYVSSLQKKPAVAMPNLPGLTRENWLVK